MATVARKLALGVTTAAAGLVAWGTLVERHLPALRRESLPVLQPGASPLRVLHLSDLHLAPWQAQKIEWVRSLSHLRPDLVVLTGDLMGHLDAADALRHAFAPLAAAGIPAVFVHGSNDYYGPIVKNPLKYLQSPTRLSTRTPDIDTDALTHMLESDLGFVNLNNSATDLAIRGHAVRFFGLNDPHIHYDDIAAMSEKLDSLDAEVSCDLRLGLVHAPYQNALDALVSKRADLILAGHTHGGQVRAPFIGALTSNSDLPNAQSRGLSVWYDDTHAAFLHVSAGLGTSIYAPIRVLCRPEATLITLTASDRGLGDE